MFRTGRNVQGRRGYSDQDRTSVPSAPLRRPGAVASADTGSRSVRPSPSAAGRRVRGSRQRGDENARLHDYESGVKARFDGIVPVLKEISALQHERDFERQAQAIAKRSLGFELPEEILADAWVEQLDMRRLFAWCVFATYRDYCDDFYSNDPLATGHEAQFQGFLQDCGFHTLDISPCADGRLAHVIRYVLRLPQQEVRRKSYAGALFDVENSLAKWIEVEMRRYREGVPNTADAPTRYLKAVVYHYSSVDPLHQGCAAHGSDTEKAAQAGLDRLESFRTAVENSFCCGASIDLLLIGLDTDTDAIRVHLPDASGRIDLQRFDDALDLERKRGADESAIAVALRGSNADSSDGMIRFAARLVSNNLRQVDYVRDYHGSHYADIGHAERFIGAGVGFEEVQLRNLMYFAYMNTVEESTADLDVGVKIFTGLNVRHGLPIPVVIRYDYHGHVPGSRDRAVARCQRVADAMHARYHTLSEKGLLHTLQVTRDCDGGEGLEMLACTVRGETGEAH
ncbi:MAG: carboxysome shell carbonic anhydrase [Chromatiales bacterium]|nr:carboxysome shell carbonic anhydrase [Chromatiales bacterium]